MDYKVVGYATKPTRRSQDFKKYDTLAEFREAHPRRRFVWQVCVEQEGSYRIFSQRKIVSELVKENE